MTRRDDRKQSVYFPDDMIKELRAEAVRLDRPLSWLIQQAVRHALPQLRKVPTAGLLMGEAPPPED